MRITDGLPRVGIPHLSVVILSFLAGIGVLHLFGSKNCLVGYYKSIAQLPIAVITPPFPTVLHQWFVALIIRYILHYLPIYSRFFVTVWFNYYFFFKSMLSQTCVHLWLIFRRKVSTLLDWIIEFMVHFEAKYFDYLRYLPIFSRLFITFWFNFLKN